jgi:hypothetical protein
MTPNNRFAAFALSLVLGSGAVVSARASIATAASFDEKVDNAAAIVLGKCVRNESKWDPSGRWIVTYSTFQVESTIKGAPAQEVTVVVPGGTVGGVHQSSVGLPAFTEGAENVLFIRNSKLGPTVLYFEQGAYDVTTDERGDKVIAPVASDAVHLDTQRGTAVPAEAPRTLRQFKSDVDRSVQSSMERKARMELVRGRQQKDSSTLSAMIMNNKLIIGALLVGLALATWQYLRRT